MKKLLLACGLIGFISTAHAHPPKPMMSERPGKTMEMCEHSDAPAEHAAQLQKNLQLSDGQTAQVKKIFEDKAQQHQIIQDKYKPQLDAYHADMKKLHEQTHTQLNGILTPAQQQALAAQHKAHDHDMCQNDKGGDGGHAHHEKMPMK
jgi:hypothetical protein